MVPTMKQDFSKGACMFEGSLEHNVIIICDGVRGEDCAELTI